jgi:hypothetical protein
LDRERLFHWCRLALNSDRLQYLHDGASKLRLFFEKLFDSAVRLDGMLRRCQVQDKRAVPAMPQAHGVEPVHLHWPAKDEHQYGWEDWEHSLLRGL